MEVLLSYTGPLKYDTIGLLIHRLKDKASEMGLKLVLYKKILLVMIESLENVLKYNEHFNDKINLQKQYLPTFNIQQINDKYILSSSNAVLNTDIPGLTRRISLINSLDPDGLKKLYKETITNGQFTHKGGAGLGFIEIAKISSEKIVFNFEPIDDKLSYYRMQVVITDDLQKPV
ncbi:MAG: SiaB family protein kinase [Bacteroidales bacterium]|nr:SiaB family protein kinase [Bacteroidales bacterium]